MAQTEEKKRLLLNNKIVGYEFHCRINNITDSAPVNIYHATDISINENLCNLMDYDIDEEPQPIEYDSFEPGIKVGDDIWWFEGDIGKDKSGAKFELMYDGVVFTKVYKLTSQTIIRTITRLEALINCKQIGNIHEENKNECTKT